MKITTPHTAGFTLIEMIVSLALFATVSTVAVGSLLVLIDNNRELRGEQSLITNISFALDMMARDIRTGFDYHCATPNNQNQLNNNILNVDNLTPQSCPNGASSTGGPNRRHVLSFVEGSSRVAEDDVRMAYYFRPQPPGGSGDGVGTIMRHRGNGNADTAQSIISESINITDADFIVTGAERQDGNQPTVTIVLEVETDDGAEFTVQTTVTQRFLDI